MKVAVIGADGQLGSDVVNAFRGTGAQVVELTHRDLEISSCEDVRRVLCLQNPSVIVNTAAMHHVENCEKDPERAYAVNSIGPRNLAVAANDLDAKLIHISTDYVFNGTKGQPYLEDDPAAPLNIYGNTKLAGEAFVRGVANKWFVVRTSALYGRNPCRAKGGKNFVQLMLGLAADGRDIRVVDDEIVSPTYTTELARQIVPLSETSHYDLYHATAEGSCSWYQFANAIFESANVVAKLQKAGANEFPAKVPRPKYSVLENAGLKRLGLNSFQSWRDSLEQYLEASRAAAF